MSSSVITTKLSNKELHFEPGGSPASCDITVINGCDRFASFQVQLVAAGTDESRPANWYRMSPTASSKKPPGAATTFHVTIIDSPIPGFNGLINVKIRVFAIELAEERREMLRLIIGQQQGAIALQLELPLKQAQTRPGQPLDILLRVHNPGQQVSQALLREVAIDPRWLPGSREQQLHIPPGQTVDSHFIYQPPFGAAAPSHRYPFVLEATHNQGPPSEISGTIEVLPMGVLDCSCQPQRQSLPSRRQWRIWRSPPVTYTLTFDNASNIPQQVTVDLAEDASPPCDLTLIPATLALDPEQQGCVDLSASKTRPWFGRTRSLTLPLTVLWSDPRVEIQNPTPTLELDIKPIVPLAAQLLGALAILYLLWWLSWLNPKTPFFGHTEPVNTVKFDGLGERVISGSNDQTLIEWRVSGFLNPLIHPQKRQFPQPRSHWWQAIARRFQPREPCPVPGCSEPTQAVRVIAFRPVDNNWLAVGLETGDIHLWNLLDSSLQPVQSLRDQPDDRVFALQFSQNANFLFSGHGSGQLLQWDLRPLKQGPSPATIPPPQRQDFDFAIYAMTTLEGDSPQLALGGRFNQFRLWSPDQETQHHLSYHPGGGNDYITSLDRAQFNRHRLVSADNQGYVTLWNMQSCLDGSDDCQIIDQWQDGHDSLPVRSVALSDNGCYLVSGGDDGKVMLWPLTADGRRYLSEGQTLTQFRDRTIYSVDIKLVGDRILLAAGSNDHQEVWLTARPRSSESGCDRP